MALSMRRIILVLSVAALMAAMLVASAVPALAQPRDPDGKFDLHFPGKSGQFLVECDTEPLVGHGTLVFSPERGVHGMCDYYANNPF